MSGSHTEGMGMSKVWTVVNAEGKAFGGVSTISGRAMWFDYADDISHLNDVEALRHKRDARWLALAQRYDSSAQWKEL